MTTAIPPPSVGPESTVAPVNSPLPFFLTLALLAVPYFFLSVQLGLDPRLLPAPCPSLGAILLTFTLFHRSFPLIVTSYAEPTRKGRYGAVWTASNLNLLLSATVWMFVVARQTPDQDAVGLFVISAFGWLAVFIVMNFMFIDSFESPFNHGVNEQGRLKAELQLEKLRTSIEAAKVSILQEKEKEKESVAEAARVVQASEKKHQAGPQA